MAVIARVWRRHHIGRPMLEEPTDMATYVASIEYARKHVPVNQWDGHGRDGQPFTVVWVNWTNGALDAYEIQERA